MQQQQRAAMPVAHPVRVDRQPSKVKGIFDTIVLWSKKRYDNAVEALGKFATSALLAGNKFYEKFSFYVSKKVKAVNAKLPEKVQALIANPLINIFNKVVAHQGADINVYLDQSSFKSILGLCAKTVSEANQPISHPTWLYPTLCYVADKYVSQAVLGYASTSLQNFTPLLAINTISYAWNTLNIVEEVRNSGFVKPTDNLLLACRVFEAGLRGYFLLNPAANLLTYMALNTAAHCVTTIAQDNRVEGYNIAVSSLVNYGSQFIDEAKACIAR